MVGTIVTGIADAVQVSVILVGIGDQGAVVEAVGDAVQIGVGVGSAAAAKAWLRLARVLGAAVAGIADAVAVFILLPGVEHEGAVVLGVQDTVTIGIQIHFERPSLLPIGGKVAEIIGHRVGVHIGGSPLLGVSGGSDGAVGDAWPFRCGISPSHDIQYGVMGIQQKDFVSGAEIPTTRSCPPASIVGCNWYFCPTALIDAITGVNTVFCKKIIGAMRKYPDIPGIHDSGRKYSHAFAGSDGLLVTDFVVCEVQYRRTDIIKLHPFICSGVSSTCMAHHLGD